MSKAKSTKRRSDGNVYPPGWNYRRAKAIADYYDTRKDQPVIGEASSPRANLGLVWMEVPQDLVPEVRKLIARRQKSA
jgi:hypothetical protein